MKEIKTFMADDRPLIGEVDRCAQIASTENCIVELKWFVKWNGWHNVFVKPGDNPQDIYDRLPKVYGI